MMSFDEVEGLKEKTKIVVNRVGLDAGQIGLKKAQETIGRLELAALTHNGDGFAQEIERALGIGRDLARRLIDDASGEPVLVLGTALQMPAEVLQRILPG